ncbi:MAG: hypothetical protein HYV09_37845 [Deltaproteobacteria bacterium]|nr:hypothetical protein [Deltaproteobacteria bacterium]
MDPRAYRHADAPRPIAVEVRRRSDVRGLVAGVLFTVIGAAAAISALYARSGGELFGAIVTALAFLGLGILVTVSSIGRQSVRIDAERRTVSLRALGVGKRVALRDGDVIMTTQNEGLRELAVRRADGSWESLVISDDPEEEAPFERAAEELNRHLRGG